MIKWTIYNLLFAAVYPFLLPGFLLRMFRRGGYAARMGDRFALYPDGLFGHGEGAFVWVHAVSVGEVQVAGQMMRAWRAAEPSVRFCLSTTSSTGWKMAEREVTARDVLIYNPLDFPNFVKSALKTVRPRAIVLTESEIWPNFIRTAHKYGIPLFLVNARVSDRSAPRYKLARWWFGDVLSAFTRIFAQSDLDKSRLVAAGAPADKVEVTGSFKFDAAHRNEAKEAEMRAWIGPGRILLGGSTWPGEDVEMLRAYAAVRERLPDVKLVIAPRHFEKADAVEANIRAAGFGCVRRSRKGDSAQGAGDVYLADTTGELMGLYGIADAVFVGKSLCAHGAQNMIEPCLCGKPTVTGPYTENFRPVMNDLLAADAVVQVADADGLVQKLGELLSDDGGLGARAAAAVARRRGVTAACVAAMLKLVPVLLLSALVLAAGCSKEEEPQPVAHPEMCEPVKAAIEHIRRLQGRCTVEHLDVRGMRADEFRARLMAHPEREVCVWMPGERDWLLVCRDVTNRVSLANVMDRFAVDTNSTMSVAEVFASYVGTREDILPAFSSKLTGEVLPEWFVTKEIPPIAWLDTAGIDEDILKATLAEIRSVQIVRRELLKGNMLAAKATDKKGEEAATEVWARVALRNPNDPMLLERIENLNRNARGFLSVGKVLPAMKCYETIVLIRPSDAAAVHNFGMCLKKIGKLDLAEKVLARAKKLGDL